MDRRAEYQSQVWAVILAAGESRRFGSSKLLAPYRGEPLVVRAVREASEVFNARTLLVTGHDGARVAAAAKRFGPEILHNGMYQRGIGNSLAAAATCLGARASAMLVMLADQPMVSAGHLRLLLGAWDGERDKIVATVYGETTGVPALLPSGTFDEVRRFDDDRGARRLFDEPGFSLETVRLEAAAIDIDTPADLKKLYVDE